MSVHVTLDIIPQHIDPAAWAAVYDDTLKLLQSHPSHLVGYDERDVAGTLLPMYTHAIEQKSDEPEDQRYCISGDLQSRQTAEPVIVYRDFSHYSHYPSPPVSDILLLDREATLVFAGETDGAPYHESLLAAALVVEDRFPRAALVSGHIDRVQATRARDWAESVLGQSFSLPVRVDPPALFERLSAFCTGDALIREFGRLYVGEIDEILNAIIAYADRDAAERWLLGELIDHLSPLEIGARSLFIGWLNATGDLGRLCELVARDPRGPRYDGKDLAEALAHTWIALSNDESACFLPYLKPQGEQATPNTQWGAVVFDIAAVGRRLRKRFSRDEIQSALASTFGNATPKLLAALDAETSRIRGAIAMVRPSLERVAKRAAESEGKEVEDLAALPEPLSLSLEQREAVARVAFEARRLCHFLARDEPERFEPLLRDPAHAKAVLAHIVDNKCEVYTEHAWDWIRAEQDTAPLVLLIALSRQSPRSPIEHIVRRALFENKALCHLAVALTRDEAAMAEVAKKRAPRPKRPTGPRRRRHCRSSSG